MVTSRHRVVDVENRFEDLKMIWSFIIYYFDLLFNSDSQIRSSMSSKLVMPTRVFSVCISFSLLFRHTCLDIDSKPPASSPVTSLLLLNLCSASAGLRADVEIGLYTYTLCVNVQK
jgi:hypothetical protein